MAMLQNKMGQRHILITHDSYYRSDWTVSFATAAETAAIIDSLLLCRLNSDWCRNCLSSVCGV